MESGTKLALLDVKCHTNKKWCHHTGDFAQLVKFKNDILFEVEENWNGEQGEKICNCHVKKEEIGWLQP